MKLYLDLIGGISGDMFLAGLLNLGLSLDKLEQQLQCLNLPGWHIHASPTIVNGLTGMHLDVHCHEHIHEHHEDSGSHHNHHHEHRGFTDIKHLIENSSLSPWVKQHAINIFLRIGNAEAKIHGKTLETIHFHEVGAIDSIIDIVGACIGLEILGKPEVLASHPTDGTGFTHCAHGQIPIPVPATLAILGNRGIAIAQCDEPAEMITPTGAGILAEFVKSFGKMDGIIAEKIGYSFGSRTLKTRPNMLRLVLGSAVIENQTSSDTVELIQTNIDDCTPEILGYVMERAFSLGALDVWHTPIQMKKNRPGVELSLLCQSDIVEVLTELIFKETGTLGIRQQSIKRIVLDRETSVVTSPYGEISIKTAKFKGKTIQNKPEFEDCRKIAIKTNTPLRDIVKSVSIKTP